jgi:prepilin-type N-terminal cleavage/methylation domain-containing protein
MAHCQLPIDRLPMPGAVPRRHVSRGFTLVEILLSISLLSFIVLGLFAMFNQTQRAFKLGMTQSDILEAGRAVTEMMPRELEQAAPSHRNAVNFSVAMIPNLAPLPPLTQSLPGTTLLRTNLLQDCFILLRQNQTWTGIGYCVRTNDSTGHLWLPEVTPGQLGAGTLYRFASSTNALGSDGLPSDPTQLYAAFLRASAPGSAAISNRICDGVVHFRLRAFATNGFPIVGLGTNACFRTNSLTLGCSVVRQTLALPNDEYPDNWCGLYFASDAVPAAVEMELGLLEQRAWDRYNSIGNGDARLAYLKREDISSLVHLFRQRVPIRNVDPSAYQ